MNIVFDDITPIRARRTDPQTSKDAAKNAKNFAATHKGRIVEALRGKAGLTAKFIAHDTGLTVEQIDRRLPELEAKGLAEVVRFGGVDMVFQGYRVWRLCGNMV